MSEETISIPYVAAEKEGLVGKIYSIWVERVPHLDQMTREIISHEWQNGSIELVIPKTTLD